MSFFIGFLHTGFTAHPYGAFYAIEQIDGFIHLLHIVKGMCGGMRLLLFQDAFVEVFKADVTVFFQTQQVGDVFGTDITRILHVGFPPAHVGIAHYV